MKYPKWTLNSLLSILLPMLDTEIWKEIWEKYGDKFYLNRTVAVLLFSHMKDFVSKELRSTSVWIASCETKVWFHYLSKATSPHCEKLINLKWKITAQKRMGGILSFSFSCKLEGNDFWLKDDLAKGLALQRKSAVRSRELMTAQKARGVVKPHTCIIGLSAAYITRGIPFHSPFPGKHSPSVLSV